VQDFDHARGEAEHAAEQQPEQVPADESQQLVLAAQREADCCADRDQTEREHDVHDPTAILK
jgi:hypothetical protein